MRSVLDSLRATVASLVRSRRSLLFAVSLILPVITVVVLVVAISPALKGSGSVPVAVVNLDEGATREGVAIHAGEDLVDSLENTDTLLWSVVDEQDADAGLEDGTYAFALKVPKDYSAAIASLRVMTRTRRRSRSSRAAPRIYWPRVPVLRRFSSCRHGFAAMLGRIISFLC